MIRSALGAAFFCVPPIAFVVARRALVARAVAEVRTVSTTASPCDSCDCGKEYPLAGTVKPFHRHVMIHSNLAATVWAPAYPKTPKIADATVEPFVLNLAAALKSVKGIKCTAVCDVDEDGSAPVDDASYTVTVMPDGCRFGGLSDGDIPALVEWLSSGVSEVSGPVSGLTQLPVPSYLVAVCAHAQRDARCGERGKAIADDFARLIDASTTEVLLTSHVGGHAWAANALIYPGVTISDEEHDNEKSIGEFYGLLKDEADVQRVLDAHVNGAGLQGCLDLWRGRIGLGKDEHTALVKAMDGQ